MSYWTAFVGIRVSACTWLAAFWLAAVPVWAGVATDGSTGTKGTVTLTGPNYLIGADLGTRSGKNLFDSFSEFSLAKGQSATFTGPSNVDNIVARVTGGDASTIDGTIATKTGGHPNFYLINPYGVIFGPDGSLNVEGSFHVSTADYLKFADGTKLLSKLGKGSSFSSAAPAAFGFVAAKPAAITVNGTKLAVEAGRQFEIAGGTVTLREAKVSAPAGTFGIAAMAGPGNVSTGPPARPRQGTQLGTIKIVGSTVAVNAPTSAAHGGSLYLTGDDITVANSRLAASNAGNGAGGEIRIAAAGDLALLNGGQIVSDTSGAGSAGNLLIKATNILVSDGGIERGFISSDSNGGSGNAGDVMVRAKDSLTIRATSHNSEALISSDTYGNGHSGAVTVSAGSLTISGGDSQYFVGISAESNAHSKASGAAGDVTVRVSGDLKLLNGGVIASDSYGPGSAGRVTVTSKGNILISDNGNYSYISSDAVSGLGSAGYVFVRAEDNLTIRATNRDGDAYISSDTYGNGDGGKVSVSAGSLRIGGDDSRYFVGISAESNADPADSGTLGAHPKASGAAGDVTVRVSGDVRLLDGAEITSDTYGAGSAGRVTLTSKGNILIRDNGGSSFISSDSNGGSGNAGDVVVHAKDDLTILATDKTGDAYISSTTYGDGKGGDVVVSADLLKIDGDDSKYLVGIRAQSVADPTGSGTNGADPNAFGAAGDVTVRVSGDVRLLDGAEITTSTYGAGSAGTVTVASQSNILISDDGATPSIISSSSNGGSGNAGDVVVHAKNDLTILATDKTGDAYISSTTYGDGKGGDVVVSADLLKIDGGDGKYFVGIRAQSVADPTRSGTNGADLNVFGAAGDVTVRVPGNVRLLDGAEITTSTYGAGSAGTVTVASQSSILISGNGATPSIISSDSDGGSGNAGDVVVHAKDDLTILATDKNSDAYISSSTYGNGQGGDVTVSAGTLTINGGNSYFAVGILAESFAETPGSDISGSNPLASGNAGMVKVTVKGVLDVLNAGEISSATSGAGVGGSVSVFARAGILLDGEDSPHATAIISSTYGGTGNAGSVNVTTEGTLTIQSGGINGNAFISSSTEADGNGGVVTVSAAALTIDGSGSATGIGILAESLAYQNGVSGGNPESTGRAGKITVTVTGALQVLSGGLIASNTFADGAAGGVAVTDKSGAIVISGSGSSISSSSLKGADGVAGTVTVDAPSVTVDQGNISSSTSGAGHGGDVVLQIQHSLRLTNNATVSAASTGTGASGDVTVVAGDATIDEGATIMTSSAIGGGGNTRVSTSGLLDLTEGDITSAAQSGQLNAGNVTITSGVLLLNHGLMSANASAGDGGKMLITTEGLIETADSRITASSATGVSGTVAISASANDVTASLAELSGKLSNTDQVSHLACTFSGHRASGQSSLIISSRGAPPYDGGGPKPAFYAAPLRLPTRIMIPRRAESSPCG